MVQAPCCPSRQHAVLRAQRVAHMPDHIQLRILGIHAGPHGSRLHTAPAVGIFHLVILPQVFLFVARLSCRRRPSCRVPRHALCRIRQQIVPRHALHACAAHLHPVVGRSIRGCLRALRNGNAYVAVTPVGLVLRTCRERVTRRFWQRAFELLPHDVIHTHHAVFFSPCRDEPCRQFPFLRQLVVAHVHVP